MAPVKLVDPGFLGGISHSKSFLEALAGSTSSFPDLRPSTFRGLPSLWVSDEEIRELAAPFRFSLVGFFPSKRPPLDAIRKFFFNLKLNGEVSVTVLDSTHILIKLSNDLDYCRVFCHRSYFVFNCFMKLTKWSPCLDIRVESPIIPIWISFPHLRPHFFSPRILFGLGELFGKPLKIDGATSAGSRPSNARVLVELDVTKTYPKQVWLGSDSLGYVQEVVLDEFPQFCDVCKCLGHFTGKCRHDAVFGFPTVSDVPVENSPPLCAVNSDNGGVHAVPENLGKVIEISDVVLEDFTSVGPLGCSPAAGISPVVLVGGPSEIVLPPVVVIDSNSPAVCDVRGNLSDAAADSILSPNATPFIPSGLVDGFGISDVIVDSPVVVLVPEVVSVPVDVATSIGVGLWGSDGSPVLGVVESNGCVQVSNNSEGDVDVNASTALVSVVLEAESPSSGSGEECNPIVNSLIEVPVNEVDTQAMAKCLGDSSGLEIRNQVNWLNNSSDDESESDFDEPEHDFSVVRATVIGATRGKFWGRGRRRR
ncbi:hypothetical protein KFK09_010283 [Dendrobium nobile]|uniref:DUF4283 domain-containing protein n=1 Tax=Dendrobium nobile TaxID=94219 RepID=A0A8T3BM41_DENNO|nr:hypothetical protein KFK09_010283 [Dendrobium nobile]